MRKTSKLVFNETQKTAVMPGDEKEIAKNLECVEDIRMQLMETEQWLEQRIRRFRKYYGEDACRELLRPYRERHDEWNSKEFCADLMARWGPYHKFAARKDKVQVVKALLAFVKGNEVKLWKKGVKPPTVLEIGCGCGHFLWVLRNQVDKLVGMDTSTHMLDFTERTFRERKLMPKTREAKLNLRYGSCWNIPMENDSVDLVYQVDVCMHVGGSWRSIKEMLRVARKAVFFTGPSFEMEQWHMDERLRGKRMSWGISAPLLERRLLKWMKMGKIRTFYYRDRKDSATYKHRILIVEKGKRNEK